jgi:hypothetical protein
MKGQAGPIRNNVQDKYILEAKGIIKKAELLDEIIGLNGNTAKGK